MIAWPDFARDAAAAKPAAGFKWPIAGSRLPASNPPEAAITEAPLSDEELHPPAEAALDGKPEGSTTTAVGRRRWPLAAAVAVSLVAHAALALWLAERISRIGVEAQSDAISVEIVFEEAEPASASIAGDSTDSSEGEAEGSTTLPTVVAEKAPPDESVEESAVDEAVSPVPVEQGEAVDQEATVPAVEPTEPPMTETAQPAPPEDAVAESPTTAPAQSEAQPETAVALDELPEVLASEREAETAEPEPVEQVAEDIPLELVPAPMPRPEPPSVRRVTEPAQRAVPDKPRPAQENRSRTAKAAETPTKPAARNRAERAERGKPASAPAKARTAGNAARSASSAGATAAYARKINAHLRRHQRYPDEAARQRLKGTVRLAVSIDRSGRLIGARVGGGSGHQVLDREAVAAAKRASPYPAPPEGIRANPLTLTLSLRFGR